MHIGDSGIIGRSDNFFCYVWRSCLVHEESNGTLSASGVDKTRGEMLEVVGILRELAALSIRAEKVQVSGTRPPQSRHQRPRVGNTQFALC